jgi:hypothetical protein
MFSLYTKKILILGLTKADLTTLQAGKPLHLEITPPRTRVTMLYGADKPAILSHLELLGFEIPPGARKLAEDDPA